MLNYEDPEGPLFSGSFVAGVPSVADSMTVVSYNIHFAQDPQQAVDDLSNLAAIDLLLLQETDERAVELIARALAMDFIYYPVSVHNRHDRNFGNAILSRWPLSEPAKIILPHRNPRNDQMRAATRAVVEFGSEEILVYSVHTETSWLGYRKRLEQIDALLESVEPGVDLVIIAGDFNTLSPGSKSDLEDRFGRAGMLNATRDLGGTTKHPLASITLDYIFTRGMSIDSAGKFVGADASDHLPIWVQMKPDNAGHIE
ncbi:MAG: endonuclease/exonuclease/phosphatase family protein [Anaerolineales bacterium]|jgi:endonuclease/exonuclease/phosphatase family metal-dependent hydrolase